MQTHYVKLIWQKIYWLNYCKPISFIISQYSGSTISSWRPPVSADGCGGSMATSGGLTLPSIPLPARCMWLTSRVDLLERIAWFWNVLCGGDSDWLDGLWHTACNLWLAEIFPRDDERLGLVTDDVDDGRAFHTYFPFFIWKWTRFPVCGDICPRILLAFVRLLRNQVYKTKT